LVNTAKGDQQPELLKQRRFLGGTITAIGYFATQGEKSQVLLFLIKQI
jgi:hypothetical protein